MHSRIFVLRQVRDDVKLPSMENVTRISEEELYRSFTYYCDYVIKQKSSSWHDDIQWLCHVYNMFDMHKDNEHNTIITLDIKKANKHLEKVYDLFLEKVSRLSLISFKKSWSGDVYNIEQLLKNTSGFWIITVGDNGDWSLSNVDDFCRTYIREAETESKDVYSFRLEDIFDYHF